MSARSIRSFAPLTDENFRRLAEIARARDRDLRAARPDWCSRLLAACLVQGAARHFVHSDRGIKDLDVYLFYALPLGKRPNAFPYLRGSEPRDFGDSDHGRQLYTDEQRSDPKLAARIPEWERYAGRRVDLMARAIAPDADPRAAVCRWLDDGARKPGSSGWHLAQAPVVCLIPKLKAVWWGGPGNDAVATVKRACC
jgi:hypothetical protein